MRCISSSQACLSLKDQLEKSKEAVFQYMALLEKLQVISGLRFSFCIYLYKIYVVYLVMKLSSIRKFQVEKDSIVWREREMNIKNELHDVSRKTSAVADSRMATLDVEIQKQLDEKLRIKTRLENISRERGHKLITLTSNSVSPTHPCFALKSD